MKTRHVLVLGAGGNVSRHSVPKLVAKGHNVSALVRNPDHAERLIDDGATVIVRDLTSLDEEGWARLLTPFDVVVWSAGAGGGSAERTYAVDRDAAMGMIDALEDLGEFAPFLVMVSYAGASEATTEDDGGAWYAYVESKKAVDKRLLASELAYQILGPTRLTDDAAEGITVLDGALDADSETPRELVAEVIVESVGRGETFNRNPIDFEGGNGAVAEI
ncbi:NAD(P)H-binding protein [Corynebacterium sp. zg912]|uniref:NAD(P)H-binding protein n=1 Tax=Corynebacterium wankanglinii TaxID=2735136 RepID=A0A7H0K8E7_9CORY|nr:MULTISPECIES: NAD(P)H-binding protein [Corynebacterium]MBA1836961.1 NAD(P)H-binding protein [Corynebacterium wankanglinii]MCR5927936.1 NAD(P)H-binding protein [Corynebacterium sp. zg912]QNP93563.1 NAD(P)H-binding protein [Corynebacterium wankanglinii]